MSLRVSVHSVLLCATLLIPVAALAQDVPPAPGDSIQQPFADTDRADEKAADSAKKPAFDASVIAQGQAAFQANCTECHDANLSLHKQKSLNGWRNTVRRMTALEGASVPAADWETIAIYLTAVHRGADVTVDDSKQPSEHDADGRFSIYMARCPPRIAVERATFRIAGFSPRYGLELHFSRRDLFRHGQPRACLVTTVAMWRGASIWSRRR